MVISHEADSNNNYDANVTAAGTPVIEESMGVIGSLDEWLNNRYPILYTESLPTDPSVPSLPSAEDNNAINEERRAETKTFPLPQDAKALQVASNPTQEIAAVQTNGNILIVREGVSLRLTPHVENDTYACVESDGRTSAGLDVVFPSRIIPGSKSKILRTLSVNNSTGGTYLEVTDNGNEQYIGGFGLMRSGQNVSAVFVSTRVMPSGEKMVYVTIEKPHLDDASQSKAQSGEAQATNLEAIHEAIKTGVFGIERTDIREGSPVDTSNAPRNDNTTPRVVNVDHNGSITSIVEASELDAAEGNLPPVYPSSDFPANNFPRLPEGAELTSFMTGSGDTTFLGATYTDSRGERLSLISGYKMNADGKIEPLMQLPFVLQKTGLTIKGEVQMIPGPVPGMAYALYETEEGLTMTTVDTQNGLKLYDMELGSRKEGKQYTLATTGGAYPPYLIEAGDGAIAAYLSKDGALVDQPVDLGPFVINGNTLEAVGMSWPAYIAATIIQKDKEGNKTLETVNLSKEVVEMPYRVYLPLTVR